LLLLAIDTASRFISLALHDGQRLYFESTWHTANNHTIELAPGIRHALAQTQIAVTDLTAVAVSQGPGSFTGLRIGLSMAKGLAMAQQIALVVIPTLDIVAAGVPASDGALVAVLQAGRGRICAQRYARAGEHWRQAGQPVITTWEQQIETVEQLTLFAGEIDDTGRTLLAASTRPVKIAPGAFALRRAGFLAELAWARVRNGDTDDPAAVTPVYLHQPGVPTP
jgi:tRNA threonylcarbamoyladenosine biosynthesis protein TsaB